jgi:hypothetical protein
MCNAREKCSLRVNVSLPGIAEDLTREIDSEEAFLIAKVGKGGRSSESRRKNRRRKAKRKK